MAHKRILAFYIRIFVQFLCLYIQSEASGRGLPFIGMFPNHSAYAEGGKPFVLSI